MFLSPLLAYAASETPALIDAASNSPSTLMQDLCLLLADWASSADSGMPELKPTSQAEKTSAQSLLGVLIRRSLSSAGVEPNAASKSQQLNVELFKLMNECWTGSVEPLYRELLRELQLAQEFKQAAVALSLLRASLLATKDFKPSVAGLTLAK